MRITENDNLKNLTDYVEDLTVFDDYGLLTGGKANGRNEYRQAWIYVRNDGIRKRITVLYAVDWTLHSSKMDNLLNAYRQFERNLITKGTLKCIARDYVRTYDIVRGEFEVYDVKLPQIDIK